MPYSDHEMTILPQGKKKIWRYMDYSSSVWLLTEKQLHFHRADLLDDPYEGSIPELAKVERDRKITKEIRKGSLPDDFVEVHEETGKKAREWTYLNCWRIGQKDSAAMWDLYGGKNSVAITTSVESLKSAFEAEEDHTIHMSKVQYIDFLNPDFEKMVELLPEQGVNHLHPFLMKRKSYEYESELRAIIIKPSMITDVEFEEIESNFEIEGQEKKHRIMIAQNNEFGILDTTSTPESEGIDVEIDLRSLIDRIYVSQRADDWFYEAVVNSIESLGPSWLGEGDIYRSSDPVY